MVGYLAWIAVGILAIEATAVLLFGAIIIICQVRDQILSAKNGIHDCSDYNYGMGCSGLCGRYSEKNREKQRFCKKNRTNEQIQRIIGRGIVWIL